MSIYGDSAEGGMDTAMAAVRTHARAAALRCISRGSSAAACGSPARWTSLQSTQAPAHRQSIFLKLPLVFCSLLFF